MVDQVSISERSSLGLATVMARRGVGGAAIAAAIGLEPSSGPGRTAGPDFALIGTGPGVWLALAESPPESWPDALEQQLAGLCAISDQSGGYVVFRLSGPGARELLQRGAAIDLHPAVFGPGSAATTVIAHIGVILWRPDASESFEVAVFRSYASSFRHWLDLTSAWLGPTSTRPHATSS